MPHGLENTISARPSPSKSPTGPNRLSPVCRFQPPKRVPLAAIIGAASDELQARGVDLDDPAEQVTADEWLAAHRADQAAEDAHRDVDEIDLHEDARAAAASSAGTCPGG